MKVWIAALALFAFMLSAGEAEAKQRYSTPTGKGTECSAGAPCSITQAVGEAAQDDEVIVGTGQYSLLLPINLKPGSTGVTIHGDFAAPMPTVGVTSALPAIDLDSVGSSLAWIGVTNAGAGNGIRCTAEGRVDRARIVARGQSTSAVFLDQGCDISDSLVLATGKEGTAIGAGATNSGVVGTARNVTAVATGEKSTGIASAFYDTSLPGTYLLELVNSIASGTREDLLAEDGPFGPGEMAVSYSNFDTVEEEGDAEIDKGEGNQKSAPLFIDAAADNYAEAAGSPTIDAGVVEPGSGTLDLAGNPRLQGGTIDIGAYEFVPPVPPAPPTPPVPPAAELQSLTVSPSTFATLNGGGAIFSAKKAPVGGRVDYALNVAVVVKFTVERKTTGRKAGNKCVKQNKANKSKKKCPLFKPVKGSFTHLGAAGVNSFKFSGRLNSKALRPGAYRLTATAGTSARSAGFKIAR